MSAAALARPNSSKHVRNTVKARDNVWHPEREAASSDRSVFSRQFRLKM